MVRPAGLRAAHPVFGEVNAVALAVVTAPNKAEDAGLGASVPAPRQPLPPAALLHSLFAGRVHFQVVSHKAPPGRNFRCSGDQLNRRRRRRTLESDNPGVDLARRDAHRAPRKGLVVAHGCVFPAISRRIVPRKRDKAAVAWGHF